MIDLTELGTLFGGLRVAVTVVDEEYRIVFMDDLAIEHYAAGGGETLVGTDLLDCHNAKSQAQIRQMYARYRAGDLTPTRYYEDKGEGLGESIILVPLVVEGQFRGAAELMWDERPELVFEK